MISRRRARDTERRIIKSLMVKSLNYVDNRCYVHLGQASVNPSALCLNWGGTSILQAAMQKKKLFKVDINLYYDYLSSWLCPDPPRPAMLSCCDLSHLFQRRTIKMTDSPAAAAARVEQQQAMLSNCDR